MGESYIRLPNISGYMVEWETGEVKTLRSGKQIKLKDMYYTTSEAKAQEIADLRVEEGYNNVKIRPAIF